MMYSDPSIPKQKQFGGAKPVRKRGRRSALDRFLERQGDLFPVEKAIAELAPHYITSPARIQEGGERD